MSFFREHQNELNLAAKEDQSDAEGLREAQLGAYWATLAHFTASDRPALISLPTGAGKTALIPLLAWGLGAERVLVITPAVELRRQTADKVRTLEALRAGATVPTGVGEPEVAIVENRLSSLDDWERLRAADVVVTTPHCASPAYESVVEPPGDLFDLMVMDEAHHSGAATWDELLQALPDAKRILMTATPFRLDRRRFRASLVYHYPLGRAIAAGIYDPVGYRPVTPKLNTRKHEALCEEAKTALEESRSGGRASQLLVRTDTIERANYLEQLYQDNGLDVRAVHTDKDDGAREEAVELCRNAETDGLVCVGMLGEGLDVPTLKVAVLHAPHKSLPVTLQLIGRVSRQRGEGVGRPFVIAVPHDVDGPMERLYRADPDWRTIVPELVAEAVGRTQADDQLDAAIQNNARSDLEIIPSRLDPFYSARCYSLKHAAAVELDADLHVAGDPHRDSAADRSFQIVFDAEVPGHRCRVLVTHEARRLPWATTLDLHDIVFELHVFYLSARGDYLLQMSSAEGIAADLRRHIVADDDLSGVSPEALNEVMRTLRSPSYLMIGMRNAVGESTRLPSYKTLLGPAVQGAVSASEGRTFAPGHALAKSVDENTWGIAHNSGRVWSIRRGGLVDFATWCRTVTEALGRASGQSGLPLLDFLAQRRSVSTIEADPISVVPPIEFETEGCVIRWAADGAVGHELRLRRPTMSVLSVAADKCEMTVHLQDEACGADIKLSYAPSRLQPWQPDIGPDEETRVIRDEAERAKLRDMPLADFLQAYPPAVVLSNGEVLWGGQALTCRTRTRLSPDVLKVRDWGSCDITSEVSNAAQGLRTVQEQLKRWLKSEVPSDAVVFFDHGSTELADYIVIDPANQEVALYHAKGSSQIKPGTRLDDHRSLVDQLCRSAGLIRSGRIIDHIRDRLDSTDSFDFVVGDQGTLDDIAERPEWPVSFRFRVVGVQPGLSRRKLINATSNSGVEDYLLAAHEWITRFDAEFEIWCSQDETPPPGLA